VAGVNQQTTTPAADKYREWQAAKDNDQPDLAAKLFAEYWRLVEREMQEKAKAA